jgi:Ribbon-helix-helix protein, copG family
MSQRCTVRLPDTLHDRLQKAADARQCGVSDLIRLALTAFLDGHGSGNGTPPLRADKPIHLPHNCDACAQTLLTMLPPDVRTAILQRATLLE